MNIIKQIVKSSPYGEQTIKMLVKTIGERGYPGVPGPAGKDGKDGVIQYTAGAGINISDQNVISATGGGGTSYTAGNAIRISEENVISADIYPAHFFTYTGRTTDIDYDGPWPWSASATEVREGKLILTVHGGLEIAGTPTPTTPQTIKPVGGYQRIDVGPTFQGEPGGIPGGDLNIFLHFNTLELYGFATHQTEPDVTDFYNSDYIYKDGGDWYVRKETAKVVLDGSVDETWGADGNCFYVTLNDKIRSIFGLCTHFDYVHEDFSTTDTAYRGKCTGFKNDTGIYFMPADASQTTLADFKAWLAQNPITVYYPLNAAYSTKITDSTLAAELENLLLAKSYGSDGTWIDTAVLDGGDTTYTTLGLNIVAKEDALNSINKDLTDLTWGYASYETDTGTTWIDGKTIYRKTVYVGALPNNIVKTVATGASRIDTIVKIEGVATGGGFTIPLPFVSISNYHVEVTIDTSNNVIRLETNTDMSAYDGYVTLYYTKLKSFN